MLALARGSCLSPTIIGALERPPWSRQNPLWHLPRGYRRYPLRSYARPGRGGNHPGYHGSSRFMTTCSTLSGGHGKPQMIAERAPQVCGLVGRTCGSPSPTGRSLADETCQATGRDWSEPFCDPIRAVAYINAGWNEHPTWQAGDALGCRGASRVQADEYLKVRWSNEKTLRSALTAQTNSLPAPG